MHSTVMLGRGGRRRAARRCRAAAARTCFANPQALLTFPRSAGHADYWVGNATEGQAAPCARVLPSSPPYLPSQETQAGTIDLAAALTSAAIQAALGDAAAAQTLAALAAEPGVAAARLPLCMSPP